jgi:hypothetical protein
MKVEYDGVEIQGKTPFYFPPLFGGSRMLVFAEIKTKKFKEISAFLT